MTRELPEHGRPWSDIEAELTGMREHDPNWRGGRHGAYIWYANDELEQVLREAFGMYMVENALGIRAFPSIARMEREVLEIVQGLLHAPAEAAGIFASGGTESIFLAVYAMREWARANRPEVQEPEIVAARSAHPALNKAAHLLGMRVRRVPVGGDFRADPAAMASALTPQTVGLYASAPAYSLGLVDPVEALGHVAAERRLWLHVDACVGGILAPSVRELGYSVPAFDFEVEGVTSVSADLHKSGYTAKPASTVTFRTRELREFARYRFDDWPSGGYSSYTFTGTRPGGAIAAAWAGMHFLGREGYRRIAVASMRAKSAIALGVCEIPGVMVYGEPELWAFAFGAPDLAMNRVAAMMGERGWICGVTTDPPGIHVMCSPVHEPAAGEYVEAIRECIEQVRAEAKPDVAASPYS